MRYSSTIVSGQLAYSDRCNEMTYHLNSYLVHIHEFQDTPVVDKSDVRLGGNVWWCDLVTHAHAVFSHDHFKHQM